MIYYIISFSLHCLKQKPILAMCGKRLYVLFPLKCLSSHLQTLATSTANFTGEDFVSDGTFYL